MDERRSASGRGATSTRAGAPDRADATAVVVYPATKLRGQVCLPGDKSISHRAAILAALADGKSEISGFSPSQDCARTLVALEKAGISVRREQDSVTIDSGGPGSWKEAEDVLDLGNSGTSMRLLAGVFAGLDGFWVLTGDASLRKRPMGRVVEPLRRMGADIYGREGGRLAPLAIRGQRLRGREFGLEVASAQVKTGILLAGLLAQGDTWVQEPLPTRDHTERMLPLFGGAIRRRGPAVGVAGSCPLRPASVSVPGDPSAAAFFCVAATLVSGAEVTLPDVGLNPHRIGFLHVLARMGGAVGDHASGEPKTGLEPRGTVLAQTARLSATAIEPTEVPSLVDELPVLAVAATQAGGVTTVRGAGELRVKESDRLATCARELFRLGANIRETGDGWIIEGPAKLHGGTVSSWGDHRLAMALAVAALVADGPVTIQDAHVVDVSYPGFFTDLASLGAPVEPLAVPSALGWG